MAEEKKRKKRSAGAGSVGAATPAPSDAFGLRGTLDAEWAKAPLDACHDHMRKLREQIRAEARTVLETVIPQKIKCLDTLIRENNYLAPNWELVGRAKSDLPRRHSHVFGGASGKLRVDVGGHSVGAAGGVASPRASQLNSTQHSRAASPTRDGGLRSPRTLARLNSSVGVGLDSETLERAASKLGTAALALGDDAMCDGDFSSGDSSDDDSSASSSSSEPMRPSARGPREPIQLNAVVMPQVRAVKVELLELLDLVSKIKCWIAMEIPSAVDRVKDFDVAVQVSLLMDIAGLENNVLAVLDELFQYFELRASILSKAVRRTRKTDYQLAVMQLDDMHVSKLCMSYALIRNGYAYLHDVLVKNMPRIVAQKGVAADRMLA